MERWLVPKGPGTHVLMDGGILQVPFEQLEEFYTECIHAVRTGKKIYVVEQKTEVFKFFVDLDYKSETPLDDSSILELVELMHSVVQKGRCYIARAPIRTVQGLVKTGVHIHWPDVFVTKKEALALRTRILLELPEDPEWSQRIDASVYSGSGLRMLWSHKREKGEDTDPYTPWRELHGSVFAGLPTSETLSLFAIRTNAESSTSVDLEITCAPLEKFIQRYMKGHTRANVRRVLRKGHDRIVVQTDSRFCERIQGEHKSNHVWFGVSQGKICQLCHDEVCKELKFVGREYNLSPSIVEELRSNVAVDNSAYVSLRDLVPDFWWKEESVSSNGTSILGTRPGRVAYVQTSTQNIRRRNTANSRSSKGSVFFD